MRFIAALFVTLVLSLSAFAQNTTLRGTVTDERGDAIPNADVVLTGKDGKARTAKSSFTGEFTIPGVPPGEYTLTSTYSGFQTQTINALRVPLVAPLNIKMAIAAVEVVTDVSANNQTVSVEPDQNLNATVLGEDFVKNLPDNEDDLRDMLNALAGPTAGNGGNGAQIMVDGFNNSGRLPPKEAIMQIRINQNPFSAEYSNPGFGRVEIITKPGLGNWRGGGGFTYRNAALDARNAFALTKPDLSLQRYNFNIGGPLLKKKMSTFIFGDRNSTVGSNNTFATTLNGPFVANVPTETVSNFIGARADYLLNNTNTINLSYYFRNSHSDNQEFAPRGFGGGFGFGGGGGGGGFGGGGFGGGGGGSTQLLLLPERGSNSENSNHIFRIAETWIINSKMIHEARLQYERSYTNQTALTSGVAINVLDAFYGGGSTCCLSTSKQNSFEYQDYLTYTTKGAKHTIKGGAQLEYDSINNISGSNFNGTYTFSTLAQYAAVVNALNNPSLAQCNPLLPIDPQNPASNPCATQLQINRGSTDLSYGMFRGSLFAGDDWRVSQNLTFSYGLRAEFQTRLQDKNNFAPRLGLAWSPFKSRKTTIRAGGGVFYDRLRTNQYEQTLRYNGTFQQSYFIQNAVFSLTNPLAVNPNALAQSNTIRILDPNLKAPYDINGTLGVEQQLPKGIVGTLTYIYSRGVHQFRTRDVNAPTSFVPNPARPGSFIGIRPDPTKGIVYQTESTAFSDTHRLQFGFNRRLGRVITFGNYSLSWIRSDGEGTPVDYRYLTLEYGRSNADVRHNFFTGMFINLPHGFRINSFINASSGRPFNILTGLDSNGDGIFNDRPLDLNGLPIQRNSDLSPALYSTAQFNRQICPPGSTCTDSTGRLDATRLVRLGDYLAQKYPNGVDAQGPGNFSVRTSVAKTFGFGKRDSGNNANAGGGRGGGGGGRGGGMGGPGGGPRMMGGPGGGGPMMMGMGGSENSRYNITLEITASNLFNRVNYGQYNGTLGSPLFGLPGSSGPARQLEFSVRFGF